ncbi:hypothetical protein CAPTEDRAFT_94424, partial [Capitella teleta]
MDVQLSFFYLVLCVASNITPAIANDNGPIWCPVNCTCDEKDFSVDCSRGMFETVPPDIPNFTRKLDLSDNSITTVANDTFRELTHLTKLNLFANLISTLEEDALKGMKQLRRLTLGANPLSVDNLEKSVFGILKQQALSWMYLAANTIMYLKQSHFEGFESLELLDLGRNAISEIDPHCFMPLKSLAKLDLSSNRIYSIDDTLFEPM